VSANGRIGVLIDDDPIEGLNKAIHEGDGADCPALWSQRFSVSPAGLDQFDRRASSRPFFGGKHDNRHRFWGFSPAQHTLSAELIFEAMQANMEELGVRDDPSSVKMVPSTDPLRYHPVISGLEGNRSLPGGHNFPYRR
jgi:hypothetical protein